VGDRLVRVSQKLQLVAFRKIGDAQNHIEDQLADIKFDLVRNVTGQALDFNFAGDLLENSALLL